MVVELLQSISFVVVVMPLYFALCFVFARKSGWSQLAEKYKRSPPYGYWFRWYGKSNFWFGNWKEWPGGTIGGIGYQNLFVSASAEGLYLSAGPPMYGCPFHPTLRIPWSAIEMVEEVPESRGRVVELRLIGSPTTIRLNPKALEEALPFWGDKLKPSFLA